MFAMLLVVAMLISVFAACGGSNSAAVEDSAVSSAASEVEAPETPDEIPAEATEPEAPADEAGELAVL